MREKFTELRDFMSDYYTIPIGAYTDVIASEIFKNARLRTNDA